MWPLQRRDLIMNNDSNDASRRKLPSAIRVFEHIIVIALMLLLMAVISLSTLDLVLLLIRDLSSVRVLVLDVDEILELFGFFLLVLVGLELLVTLKAYLYQRVIQVEVVLEVSLIAVAQKIIILDAVRAGGPLLVGLASLVLALSLAFWVVRKRHPKS